MKPMDMLFDVQSTVAFHWRVLRETMNQHARSTQVPRTIGEGCWVTMSDSLDKMLFFSSPKKIISFLLIFFFSISLPPSQQQTISRGTNSFPSQEKKLVE